MEISLLQHTPNPERVVASAARNCYSKYPSDELYSKLSDDDVKSVLDKTIQSGHTSVLEHISYTFSVNGLSRSATHQLVRHRIASYSQQSQRYVKFSGNNFYIPDSIANNKDAFSLYRDCLSQVKESYNSLLALGIDKEDARYLLPNAALSNITFTMNARELLNFFKLRCCNRAQGEIRELSWAMLRLVEKTAPNIFKYGGPSCFVNGACSEGEMCCRRPYKREKVKEDKAFNSKKEYYNHPYIYVKTEVESTSVYVKVTDGEGNMWMIDTLAIDFLPSTYDKLKDTISRMTTGEYAYMIEIAKSVFATLYPPIKLTDNQIDNFEPLLNLDDYVLGNKDDCDTSFYMSHNLETIYLKLK